MHQNKRRRISNADNNVAAVVHKRGLGGDIYCSSSSVNGTKSTPPRIASKTLTKQKKHNPQSVEESGGQRVLRRIEVCVICGSSNEVVDLSSNPIMKETMSSYCEDDVDLDDCLSSVCITCVFKSRAVKDVQNKLKLRLKDFSNGHALKSNQNKRAMEYRNGEEELAERESMEEKSYQKEEMIELNPDIKLRANSVRMNGINDINYSSPGRMRAFDSSNTVSPRFSATSFLHSSNSPIYKTTNSIKSVEYVEHKSIIQLDYKNYNVMDISTSGPTIQHVESINAEYNNNVRKLILSPQRRDFMPISNNNASSMASSCSNSTHSQNGLSHSMLQVVRERPESVLITESGGPINNYKSSKRPLTQRLCQYCGTSYIRKDHYNKHIRRCRNISARSLPPLPASNAENKKQFNAKRIRTNGINNNFNITTIPIETPQKHQTRKFHCGECLATMDNVTELRQHRKTHLRQYKCNMCKKVFTASYEHDFHRAICLAENRARLEEQEETTSIYDNKSVVKSERSIATRRVTRAQSRAQTQVIKNPKTATTTKLVSTISKRRMTVLTSVSKTIAACYDDGNSDIDACNSGDENDDDDDDDDESVADSMDRRIFTNDWLENRHTSEVCSAPPIQKDSRKEYDLMLLERLKAQVKTHQFTCLVENCNFYTDTLGNILLHDYSDHFKNSWFYCQKCGKVFTSKVFLDYHLDRQNFGRYICYKCSEQFMFQHQLDLHLILHTKDMNHPCNKCKCEFLTEAKLCQHMKIDHNNESEKKLIRIQSKATFASSFYTTDEDDFINGKQCKQPRVKILNMHLPHMPSKRPLQLPGHKPYRLHIGNIEFENDRNPNCCSCK